MEIELKPLKEKHAYTSYKWRNNPEVWEHTFNKPNKEITLKNELAWIKKIKTFENRYSFAILCDKVYVGNIYLTNIEDKTSFYGIFIGETSYWGKGIGTKATKLILDFGFNRLDLNKVNLRVKAGNRGAFLVYSKLGFKKIKVVGTTIHMSLIKTDFENLVRNKQI